MNKTAISTSLARISRLVYLAINAALLTACSALIVSPVPTDEPGAAGVIQASPTTLPSPTTQLAENTPEPGLEATTASTASEEAQAPTETFLPVVTQPEPINVSALPDPDLYTWKQVFTGLQKPVFVSGAGDGSGRLFIVIQGGKVFVAKNGQIQQQPFLDISAIVRGPHNTTGYTERGLLGFAFHPNYAQNGLFFVHYTDLNGNTVLARYQVSGGNPDQADSSSAAVLLTQQQPYANHNGGTIAFGPDGMLYMGLGDGGSGGDPLGAGQDLQTLLGKILRLDVNTAFPYAIPTDNPYANGGGLPEIWALGLRNPWRFSFDRLLGDLYIADVGQNEWEEIDFLPAGSPGGANFGWNYREGSGPYQGEPPASLTLIDPVAEYPHSQGCSVSGGVAVRDLNLPEWRGVYLYGDFCSGRVWGLLKAGSEKWLNAEMFQTGHNISSFGEDDNGSVYLLDHSQGNIYQLTKK